MEKLKIFKEIISFLMDNKKFWILPIVIVFVLVGILVVTAQSTPVAPFIYTMF